MINIDCGICRDLIPLVRDGVAGRSSREAVSEHIKKCRACREYFGGEDIEGPDSEAVPMDDARILGRIKKRMAVTAAAVITLAVLMGMALSVSENMFYNIIIIPAVGAAAYILLRGRWLWGGLFVLAAAFLRHLFIFDSEMTVGERLLGALQWAGIYGALCVLGMAAALLLHVAFGKERQL